MKKVFPLIIFLLLFVSSCGSSPAALTATANIALIQTQTAAPTNTPSPTTTSTITPTLTPTITPTPLGGGSVIAYVADMNNKGVVTFNNLTTNNISFFTIQSSEQTNSEFGITFFSISPNRTKIVFAQSTCPARQTGQTRVDCSRELFTSNIDGSNVTQITNIKAVQEPAWSSDGTKIAFVQIFPPSSSDIYVVDTDGKNKKRLTESEGLDLSPAWSPNGEKIAFSSQRVGYSKIYIMNSDGSGDVSQLPCYKNAICGNPSWSPDGLQITFITHYIQSKTSDIYIMDADGSNQINLTAGKYSNVSAPTWSPDGTMIAFICNQYICTMYSDGTNIIELNNLSSIHKYSGLSWFLP